MEITEGEEKIKGTENIIKAIMAENFLNLGKYTSRYKRPKRSQIG